MAVLLTFATLLLSPSGVLGIYFKQLGITADQLGQLMAQASLVGLVSLLFSRLATKGRKKLMAWDAVLGGLVIMAFLLLPTINENFGHGLMLLAALALLMVWQIVDGLSGLVWFPILQSITLPSRRGAFLGRMRLIWAAFGVVATLLSARLIGDTADLRLLMVLIALAGCSFWAILWPLHRIVEPPGIQRPLAVTWPEFFRALRRHPMSVRSCFCDALCWFSRSMFNVFQLYFLTKALRWTDSAAIDVVWIYLAGWGLSSFFWGAVADRLGDRAVTNVGLIGAVLTGFCWIAAGDNGFASKTLIFAGSFAQAIFDSASIMGRTRVMLNSIPDRFSPMLMAARKVLTVLAIAGASALGATILEYLPTWQWAPWSGPWVGLNAYKILFIIAAVCYLICIWVARKFPTEPGRTSWTVLAAMFNRPFLTTRIISRIDSSLPENTRVNLLQDLGRTGSPLAYKDLTLGLHDASYDVRLASVHALAARVDPHSCRTLIDILQQGELDIQPEAAWALGEIGDPRAIPPLIKCLQSPSTLLRGRAARALGKLQAADAIPFLRTMLVRDPDSFVRRSAAIALSRLNVRDTLSDIFQQFRLAQTQLGQRELALALANLVHGGDLYYRIRRQETRALDLLLSEAIDRCLPESADLSDLRNCFDEMLHSLRNDDPQALRATANQAIAAGLLHEPQGNASLLFRYLQTTAPEKPWSQEHSALFIFLLIEELNLRNHTSDF